jgi:hypothetical protein
MNRRKLLMAISAVGVGGVAASGTGAFTSASAGRNLDVTVAGDAAGYLSLAGTGPNDEYIDDSDDEFAIDLTDDNTTSGNGQALNPDSVTTIEDLFEIRNQGTQEVQVEATPLAFQDTDSGNSVLVLIVPEASFPTVTLPVGDAESYSIVAETITPDDSFNLNIDSSITITAEATP